MRSILVALLAVSTAGCPAPIVPAFELEILSLDGQVPSRTIDPADPSAQGAVFAAYSLRVPEGADQSAPVTSLIIGVESLDAGDGNPNSPLVQLVVRDAAGTALSAPVDPQLSGDLLIDVSSLGLDILQGESFDFTVTADPAPLADPVVGSAVLPGTRARVVLKGVEGPQGTYESAPVPANVMTFDGPIFAPPTLVLTPIDDPLFESNATVGAIEGDPSDNITVKTFLMGAEGEAGGPPLVITSVRPLIELLEGGPGKNFPVQKMRLVCNDPGGCGDVQQFEVLGGADNEAAIAEASDGAGGICFCSQPVLSRGFEIPIGETFLVRMEIDVVNISSSEQEGVHTALSGTKFRVSLPDGAFVGPLGPYQNTAPVAATDRTFTAGRPSFGTCGFVDSTCTPDTEIFFPHGDAPTKVWTGIMNPIGQAQVFDLSFDVIHTPNLVLAQPKLRLVKKFFNLQGDLVVVSERVVDGVESNVVSGQRLLSFPADTELIKSAAGERLEVSVTYVITGIQNTGDSVTATIVTDPPEQLPWEDGFRSYLGNLVGFIAEPSRTVQAF